MSKRLVMVLAGFAFIFWCDIAEAGIVINEVQLYPTGERFIELYNQDSVEVDLTDWYIQRKTQTADSFGSLVSKTNFEGKKIGGNKYFVISRASITNSDIVLDSLTLTESNTVQIKNKDGVVVDIICWGDVSDCGPYKTSNPEEGKSIQRNQTGLFISTPTPGAQNELDEKKDETPAPDPKPDHTPTPAPSGGGTGYSEKVETKKLETNILAKSVVYRGISALFGAETTGVSNDKLLYGKYFWNFGDGDAKETKTNDISKFTHTFPYEGEYNVTLEYYENYYVSTPNASDKFLVKVIKPEIIISSVGDEKDFFVEITNNTTYEADLSGWVLLGDKKSFLFPRNSFIQSKKKMILSPKITGFSILDKNSLKILSSYQDVVFDYAVVITSKVEEKIEEVKILTVAKAESKQNVKEIEVAQIKESKKSEEILDNNLQAQVLGSNKEVSKTVFDIKYAVFLFVFLGLGAGAVYFVRVHYRKPALEKAGSDFEILE